MLHMLPFLATIFWLLIDFFAFLLNSPLDTIISDFNMPSNSGFLIAEIIFYCVMEFLLCYLGFLFLYLLSRKLGKKPKESLFLFIVLTFLLLIYNSLFSVNTFYSVVPYWEGSRALSQQLVLFITISISILVITRGNKKRYLITSFIVLGVLYSPLFMVEVSHNNKAPEKNVFLIGVDSLRVDAVDNLNSQYVNSFLKSGAVYDNAYTPIARTHTALTALLSGQYPIDNGVRFNLQQYTQGYNTLLPNVLKKSGYTTLFGMDERKFSNIDEKYGFDLTVGPTPGAVEMSLDKIFQNPMSIVLGEIPAISYLVDYRSVNRANYSNYDERDFNQQIISALNTTEADAPIFAHIHYTVPHWPLLTSHVSTQDTLAETYDEALLDAGAQIDQLFSFLKEHHYLNNAVVIFYADHGESLPANMGGYGRLDNPSVDNHYGHGTAILSQAQYHVPLVVQEFKNGQALSQHETSNDVVSLVQVASTVLEQVGLNSPAAYEQSLSTKLPYVLVETGAVTEALKSSDIDEREVVKENVQHYEIDGRSVVFKTADVQEKVRLKQFGFATDSNVYSYVYMGNCWQKLNVDTLAIDQCMPTIAFDNNIQTYMIQVLKRYDFDIK